LLKTESVSYLRKRLEQALKQAESQIVVTTIQETAEKAQVDKKKEEEQIEEVSYEMFTSHIGKVDTKNRK